MAERRARRPYHRRPSKYCDALERSGIRRTARDHDGGQNWDAALANGGAASRLKSGPCGGAPAGPLSISGTSSRPRTRIFPSKQPTSPRRRAPCRSWRPESAGIERGDMAAAQGGQTPRAANRRLQICWIRLCDPALPVKFLRLPLKSRSLLPPSPAAAWRTPSCHAVAAGRNRRSDPARRAAPRAPDRRAGRRALLVRTAFTCARRGARRRWNAASLFAAAAPSRD